MNWVSCGCKNYQHNINSTIKTLVITKKINDEKCVKENSYEEN
jgi:hypothetical protein